MKILRGKKAIVTGAAAGIGRAIALALAGRGANVYLLDVDTAGLSEVAAEARRLGVAAAGHCCDLAEPGRVTAAAAAVLGEWGGVDVLVNNSGVAYYGPTERMTAAQWDRLLAVNLRAPVQLTCELPPHLLARPEAHVLNVCSVAGLVAGGKLAAYHTSKFGLVDFSEALRAEYSRRGLGVTALCPGLVRTGLLKTATNGRPGKPLPEPPRWLCATPEPVAARAVRAIRRNEGLTLATPMAYGLWLLKRLSPRLVAFLAATGRTRRRAAA